ETAGGPDALNGGRREGKRDRARNLGNFLTEVRLDRFITFVLLFALSPFLQADPKRGTVGVARKTEQIEAGDGSTISNAGRRKRDFFHLLANCHSAFQRSGIGELNADIKETLIFLRQEAGRKFFAEDSGRDRHQAEEQETEGRFANQNSAETDVAFREPIIATIEPLEKSTEQTFARSRGSQKQGGKRRAKGQRVKRRDEHRNRNRNSELLIKSPGDTRNEDRWEENR